METLNQARNCHKSWYWHTLPKSNYKPMQFGIFGSSCLRNTAAQQTPFLLVQLSPSVGGAECESVPPKGDPRLYKPPLDR
jgi:hypothetical protein